MNRNNKNIVVILGAVIAGLFLGWLFFGGSNSVETNTHEHAEVAGEWTCSMHPDIRRSEPGDCPICGMELIPVLEGGDLDSEVYQMSEEAMKLANIRTMTVGANAASKEMRLNGKVTVDERNTYSQSTHIPGRIENLKVNFTGEEVNRGQTLAVVYSPELVTAQEELLQAYSMREEQPQLYEAVRQKLSNWRISDHLMDQIVASGKPLQRFPISADVSGVVIEKFVELGDYVERGMPLYSISDLSKVWVLFDLYESQMAWVKEGSTIEFTVASLPGETFEGKISFIDPLLDNVTRVSTARVEVNNAEGKLKPEMFVSGIVETKLGEAASTEIVVPKSAVLWTGKRSLVYIKEDIGNKAGFSLREVVLGPSLGDTYVIQEGLREGEEIVVNGTFTVDAAVQLSGRPSMMNADFADPSKMQDHEENLKIILENDGVHFREITPTAFKENLSILLDTYLKMKESLIEGDSSQSSDLSGSFLSDLNSIQLEVPSDEATEYWAKKKIALEAAAQSIQETSNLEEQRNHFVALSEEMIKSLVVFGLNNQSIFVDHCPMANSDAGAYWLSDYKDIRNPYFGEAMMNCGEIVKEIN